MWKLHNQRLAEAAMVSAKLWSLSSDQTEMRELALPDLAAFYFLTSAHLAKRLLAYSLTVEDRQRADPMILNCLNYLKKKIK